MPLCASQMRLVQSVCGWAFASVTPPCVAHRVWPMPREIFGFCPPNGGFEASSFVSRFIILPTAFSEEIPRDVCIATPAESYPRYSIFFSPSRMRGSASFLPIYPIIPHIILLVITVSYHVSRHMNFSQRKNSLRVKHVFALGRTMQTCSPIVSKHDT